MDDNIFWLFEQSKYKHKKINYKLKFVLEIVALTFDYLDKRNLKGKSFKEIYKFLVEDKGGE